MAKCLRISTACQGNEPLTHVLKCNVLGILQIDFILALLGCLPKLTTTERISKASRAGTAGFLRTVGSQAPCLQSLLHLPPVSVLASGCGDLRPQTASFWSVLPRTLLKARPSQTTLLPVAV